MKFIAYAQDPQTQVELFKMFGNGPANPAAAALIPDDRKHLNCTDPANRPSRSCSATSGTPTTTGQPWSST